MFFHGENTVKYINQRPYFQKGHQISGYYNASCDGLVVKASTSQLRGQRFES